MEEALADFNQFSGAFRRDPFRSLYVEAFGQRLDRISERYQLFAHFIFNPSGPATFARATGSSKRNRQCQIMYGIGNRIVSKGGAKKQCKHRK